MNSYHVYEAVGRGKHSAVYKARKKKTIEYYAAKSVDKSQRSKVLHEVQMLQSLDHPNILKFYSWYETSAHLWLILEYCVGGSLMKLLEQDSRLPESSIHDLGADLVKALQFLHAKGIIYCDLKPSNILLDHHGCFKLCDFGLARRLSDIERSSLAMMPRSKRGTPCYMAPELFQDNWAYSYASDFWALGCMLYECYAGRPPFIGNTFAKLVKSIISDPPPPLPGNPSSSFLSLINSLLRKDPSDRLQWPELCEHAFWISKFPSVLLPPQPYFDNMLQHPCLSERNGDRPSQYRTPHKCGDPHSGSGYKKDENSTLGNKVFKTPAKNVQSGKKFNTKTSGQVNVAKDIHLLQLSRTAKLNLLRDNEKDNYRRPLPEECENNAEVKIENNDMELDFTESPEDDAPSDADVSETTTACEKLANQNIHDKILETEHSTSHLDNLGDKAMGTGFYDKKKLDQDTCLEKLELTPSSPSRKAECMVADPATASDMSSSNLSEVFCHPSDFSVKPVIPSKRSDVTLDDVSKLPFEVVPASDYVKLSSEQLNALNNQILFVLSGSSHISEKQNAIKYLEVLSRNSDAANIITNGPVMLLLVKMLRMPKMSTLRVQVASLMGLLIRHSTYIESYLSSSGIINALTDGLRDKQDKVRRFSMAALGELLSYISTQTDHTSKEFNSKKSPLKESRSAYEWQVPSSVISLVSSILRKGEDDLAQLYALRTIENICSQGGHWTSSFANQDVVGNLCYIYKSAAKQEMTRLVAGSCLFRLVRFTPLCLQFVLNKLSLRDIASRIINGNPREQQVSLNLLNISVIRANVLTKMNKLFLSLAEEKNLVPALLQLIEHGSKLLRGKTLIFVALLCKNSHKWLSQFLGNVKLLSAVDRLLKEKDEFIQQCMEAFVQLIARTVPDILEAISADIRQMKGRKRHLPIALTGRGNQKSSSCLFLVIPHLLRSSSFKHRVVSRHVLLQLANLVKLLESHFQGRDDFQVTLLQVLELVTEEPSLILDDPKMFTSQVLLSLAIMYKGNKNGDARFLCLKILFDVIDAIFSDISLNGDSQITEDLKTISHTYFLPLYPTLVEDEDPIPMYAQKLLLILVEFNYVKVSDILQLKAVTQCFKFLLGDLSNANVNNIKLCVALVSSPEMETKILTHLHVVKRIGNLLEFVNAKEMEDFLEPTLALCKAFILCGVGSNKGSTLCEKPALLGDNAFEKIIALDRQYSVKDISDFASNMSLFLDLHGSPEVHIVDLASECVILLLKTAPRETAMGILTNLPKISYLLEFLNHNAFGLQMLRLLYALAFSCKQYLSQMMELSISIPALIKIEALLSALKSSDVPGVAAAALNLGIELKRLPRCI